MGTRIVRLSGHCRCMADVPQPAGPAIARRTALASILSLPLLKPEMLLAQGLLDPASLGSSRVSAPSAPAARARPKDWVGPGYASGMAGDVTSAIISLIRAYGNIADQIGKLQANEKDLAAKLAAAIRDKAAQLDEYRQGLFCSGCNRTRSDILSKGERFPHPGQQIIRPTPEQIANKEKELQANIDRIEAQLKDARAKLAINNPDIDTIRSQIFEGMSLWRTATGFERRIIRAEAVLDTEAYFRERDSITRGLNAAHADAAKATAIPDVRRAIGDLELWSETLRRREQSRAADMARVDDDLLRNRNTAERQVAQVAQVARDVGSRITAFGYAGYLAIVTVPMNPGGDAIGSSGEASGYGFRMGAYDKAGFGQILPRVVEFIGRSRNLAVGVAAGGAPPADRELSRADSAIAGLRRTLAALVEEQERALAAARAKRAQEEAERAAQAGSAPATGGLDSSLR